jgi:hypothetical protein
VRLNELSPATYRVCLFRKSEGLSKGHERRKKSTTFSAGKYWDHLIYPFYFI